MSSNITFFKNLFSFIRLINVSKKKKKDKLLGSMKSLGMKKKLKRNNNNNISIRIITVQLKDIGIQPKHYWNFFLKFNSPSLHIKKKWYKVFPGVKCNIHFLWKTI